MITGFFLTIFYQILAFVIGLLPVYSPPSDLISAFSTLWAYVTALAWLLPVSTLLTVLGVAITFHLVMILWHFGHLVASYLRGR